MNDNIKPWEIGAILSLFLNWSLILEGAIAWVSLWMIDSWQIWLKYTPDHLFMQPPPRHTHRMNDLRRKERIK